MNIVIMGKRFSLEYTNQMPDADTDGLCDSPTTIGKKIKVRRSLEDLRRLEIEIHEMTHAADWYKDEEWIDQFAKDISAALWRIGYRLTKG